MAKMVQIRHVADAVHRRLKAQAAAEGLSLSDYLRQQVEIIAQRPTMKEIVARLESLPPVAAQESAAELVRAGRNERERQLMRTYWENREAEAAEALEERGASPQR